MIASPFGPTGASCFSPPNRVPNPAASTTRSATAGDVTGRSEALGDLRRGLSHGDPRQHPLEGDGGLVGGAGHAYGDVSVEGAQADAGDGVRVLPEEAGAGRVGDAGPLLELRAGEPRAQAGDMHTEG